MKINLSSRFKRSYKKVPSDIQNDFDEKITLFMANINHPRLKIHKLTGKLQSCLSFYLVRGYRVLLEMNHSQEINLLDIGPHDKYKKWPN